MMEFFRNLVDFFSSPLNQMIFIPLLGVALIPALKKESAKWVALVFSIIPLIISVIMFIQYKMDTLNTEQGTMVFDHAWSWISSYNIFYRIGIDGISILLVMLTTFLFPLTIWFSFGSVDKKEKAYYALLLILEVGVIGFFVSLDMVLFYLFFEMVLIPMYLLIGIWGGKERIYASVKFFLYTLVGSLLMLVAILYLGYQVEGGFTTDYYAILQTAQGLGEREALFLFLAFALSFAIKVPLFPLHTWLPDAHTQAPTAGSVILAGVLLKMGTYGLVRFCLPFFPHAAMTLAPVMSALAVIGIIYGGMAAMVQKDIKKLVAYSSVSHLGFIVLGIFALTKESMSGAVIQMVAHGISTGALFLMVGMIYDRRHTRLIADFQGIAKRVPIFTLFFMITVLSSVGLPGLNGFIGEFLVLIGSFDSEWISGGFAVVAAFGVVVAAVYLLWMFRRVMFGPLDKEANKQLTDLTAREIGVMVPLVILMFWMGFNATPFLKLINPSSDKIVDEVNAQSRRIGARYEAAKTIQFGEAELEE